MGSIKYQKDRAFTDKIHLLAVDKIYPLLGLTLIKNINPELSALKDCSLSIDYEAINEKGNHVNIQERFRKIGGNDFTIRYRRDESKDEIEQLSEYYKIKSLLRKRPNEKFYFIYGIVDEDNLDFIKYVVISLNNLFSNIDNGKIDVLNLNPKISKYDIDSGILHAGYNENIDSSSSFLVFDVGYLKKYFDNIVLLSHGFLVPGEERPTFLASEKQIKLIEKLIKEKGYMPIKYSFDIMYKKEASTLIDFLTSQNYDNEEIKQLIHDNATLKVVSKYIK